MPGEEYIAVTAPPELLRLIPSFYPIKTLRQEEVALKVTLTPLNRLAPAASSLRVLFFLLTTIVGVAISRSRLLYYLIREIKFVTKHKTKFISSIFHYHYNDCSTKL